MRRVLPAVAFTLVVAACGGDAQPVFGSTTAPGGSSTTAAPSTSTTTPATTTEATTTTTTIPPDALALEAMATAASEPVSPSESSVGTPDTATAAAIEAELVGAGVDLTGVDIWVLPIVGTGEKMLVFSVSAAAEQLDPEDGESDLLAILPTLSSIADAEDLTRFVMHYFDTDEEGDFVLTFTTPLQVLFQADGGEVPPEDVGIQLLRLP